MFIAMKSVAVDIFFITVMKQSCCDYQDRSQYIFEKYDDVEGMGSEIHIKIKLKVIGKPKWRYRITEWILLLKD